MTNPPMRAADLYGDIQAEETSSWRHYPAGLLVTGLASLAAAYLSDHYGAPVFARLTEPLWPWLPRTAGTTR